MRRRLRIHLNGVPLHIVQRGHSREPRFLAEKDYSSDLHWLGEALGETECKLHAYILMTNHVHLLRSHDLTLFVRLLLHCLFASTE